MQLIFLLVKAVVLIGAMGLVGLVVVGLLFWYWARVTERKLRKQDTLVKQYFKAYDSDSPLAIVDTTPRLVEIGDGVYRRRYVLRPLKYRQVTRICVLFAKTLEKLNVQNIDLADADKTIGQVIETCEEDFFRAMAYVLYYSANEAEQDELRLLAGVDSVFNHLKGHITLDQMTSILEVVKMQNDIERALSSFKRLSSKKKA